MIGSLRERCAHRRWLVWCYQPVGKGIDRRAWWRERLTEWRAMNKQTITFGQAVRNALFRRVSLDTTERCYDWEVVCPHCRMMAVAEIPNRMSPQEFLGAINAQGCPTCGNKCVTDKLNDGRKPRHSEEDECES